MQTPFEALKCCPLFSVTSHLTSSREKKSTEEQPQQLSSDASAFTQRLHDPLKNTIHLPLHRALVMGDLTLLNKCLQKGMSPLMPVQREEQDPRGHKSWVKVPYITSLQLAIQHPNVKTAVNLTLRLLQVTPDVYRLTNQRNGKGLFPLTLALQHTSKAHQQQLLPCLLQYYADTYNTLTHNYTTLAPGIKTHLLTLQTAFRTQPLPNSPAVVLRTCLTNTWQLPTGLTQLVETYASPAQQLLLPPSMFLQLLHTHGPAVASPWLQQVHQPQAPCTGLSLLLQLYPEKEQTPSHPVDVACRAGRFDLAEYLIQFPSMQEDAILYAIHGCASPSDTTASSSYEPMHIKEGVAFIEKLLKENKKLIFKRDIANHTLWEIAKTVGAPPCLLQLLTRYKKAALSQSNPFQPVHLTNGAQHPPRFRLTLP